MMAYNYQNQQSSPSSHYPPPPPQSTTPLESTVMDDPNAHFQTPPGYVLVPISQLGSQQVPPSQPLVNSQQSALDVPPPQLPPRPASPNVATNLPPTQSPAPAPSATSTSVSTSGANSTAPMTFPTSIPYTLVSYPISATKELFLPPSSSPAEPTGYEATYRAIDYTDRKTPHTTVHARSATGERLAGSALYHQYWSNRIQMAFPFLPSPWEFDTKWVSDVGTCAGRVLIWNRASPDWLKKNYTDLKTGKQPIFVLECAETNRSCVSRVIVDTMQSARIEVWVPMQDQKQLDEMVVVTIAMMQRMRIKVKKDEKRLLKDEDWDRIGKFNRVAGNVLNVAGAGGGGA